MGVREMVQPGFQLIWATAQKNVEIMPEESLDFKPAGLDTRSFREIPLHMANTCVTFGSNVGKPAWERMTPYAPDAIRTRAQIIETMREAGDRFLAGLGALNDQEAARVVTTPWGAQMAQGQIMAAHIPHMFYHNGQMTIYLRMQGVKPFFLAR
jgi:uncharacterized damage-inducible protein DinB